MNMYFIAIVAPGDINTQVLQWKHWMKARYLCEAALRAPAHITLVPPFWMKPELENSLIESVTAFSLKQTGFYIQLNNFSHFKSQVLFVDLAPNKRLTKLKYALLDFLLNPKPYPVKEDKRPFHPHVTIATRDLYKENFYEAWDHFKDKKYAAEWIVQDISLLKHTLGKWGVVATSSFAPAH
ncbi:MAG: 2'-5' RNA ligase family protein [Chitinophagaceae bacterium]